MKQEIWHQFYPQRLAYEANVSDHTIFSALEEVAQKNFSRPALTFAGQTMTYRELLEEVELAAERLGSAQRMLFFGPNSRELVINFFAATKIGVFSAPSLALAKPELESQALDFEPDTIILASSELEELLPEALKGLPRVVIEEKFFPSAERQAAEKNFSADDCAVVQYTSGTTGSAKGAMMSHRNLVTNARQNAEWFGWTNQDVSVWFLPLCHTWGISCGILSTLLSGAHLVVSSPKKLDAAKLGALYREYGGTILYASATFLYRLIDDTSLNKENFLTLRHVKAGAMLTQGDLKARWDAIFTDAPMQQGYGLTEASPETHNNPPKRFKEGSVGIPIQGTSCKIVDPKNPYKELPIGERGEVAISGPQVFTGYWKKPDVSAKTLIDGWLLTGDIGVMDDEGYLTIVDRKKDLLKFRGYSIAPATIEIEVLKHPSISESIVVGKPDQREGEIPTLFFVASKPLEGSAIREFVSTSLAPYELPRIFHQVEEIPKNHLGKPLRRKLREWLMNDPRQAEDRR